MPLPAGLERSHIDDDPAAGIGRLAKADDQHILGHAEIFDRPRQGETIRWNNANVGLPVDEAVGGEVLGVDGRAVDVGENLEFVGDSRVITVGRQAVADAALAPLRLDERLDHAVIEGLVANPAVRLDGHAVWLAVHIRTINSIGFFFLWTSAFGNNASFPEAAMQTANNLSTATRGRATYVLVSPPAGKRIVQSMAEV